jgi:hypothetical protein
VYLKKYFFDIALSADAVDICKTIHPRPTLGESIGMAAEVAHGSCTDLPPVKKSKLRAANKESANLRGFAAFFTYTLV